MADPRHLDLRLRVLALSLEPAMALARILGLPLDDLQLLVADQYFREYRLRGASLRAISRRFGKSLRTVATLSQRTQRKGPLLDESRRLGWQRQVIRATSQSPLDEEGIRASAAGVEEAHVAEELDHMVTTGLLERDDAGMYRPATAQVSFAVDDEDARVESVRHFLTTVTHVLYRRFFRQEEDTEAFARVLSFSAEPDTLHEIREALYGRLREEVLSADQAASEGAPQSAVIFAAVNTPTDLAWRPKGPGSS